MHLDAGTCFQEANLILSKASIHPLIVSGYTINLQAVLPVIDKIKINNNSKSKLLRFMVHCAVY